MTLFDPDGAEPSEIILPDGSQCVEVRDPDGTVIWSASGTAWIDNFEHNSLSTYYTGDSGFQIVTTTVNEGSYALEAHPSSGSLITSRPADGLDNYPGEGDTFKFKTYMSDPDDQPAFGWCAQDEGGPGTLETMYYVAVDNTNQNCNVWSWNGSYDRHIRAGTGQDLSGQWLTIYLEHRSGGDHYVEVRNDAEDTVYGSGTGTPAISLTSGGIKWWWRGTGAQYFDAAQIV